MRDGDIVGRLGGEEFGAFLSGADKQAANAVAERIRTAVEDAEFAPNGVLHPLSVSIGGVVVHRPSEFEPVYWLADQKLCWAKQAGRNRVAMLQPA